MGEEKNKTKNQKTSPSKTNYVFLVETLGEGKYVVFMDGNGVFLSVIFAVLWGSCIRWWGEVLGRGIIFVGVALVG